ncbi:MAG: M16 family metallopeptidase [Armatimonadota bacterium]
MHRFARIPLLMLLAAVLVAAAAHAASAADEPGVVKGWLPNGLRILMKEVHTAPVVAFQVWYEVGSRNEYVGVTGISHLLEHMMFKGTPTYPKGEIDRILKRLGARSNAFTSYDYTCYWETLSSEHLELAMKIEADRMVNSLMDPREHRAEMTVVRSELEGRENNPQSVLGIETQAAAFRQHAYHVPIIGWVSDVETITTREIRDWYRTYYCPNNALLVIVGDIDVPTTMEMVRKHFGPIPKRAQPPTVHTAEQPQHGPHRLRVRKEGTTWYINIAFHAPRLVDRDTYALDVLDGIMSSGRTSRIYRSLVETQLATTAGCSNWTPRDPGLFELYATVRQGVDAEKVEKALLAEVEKAKTTLPSQDELKRVKNQVAAAYVFKNDSVTSQAFALGGNETIASWRYGETYVQNIRAVTPEQVQRAARKYLTEDNMTVGILEPIPPKEGAPTGGGRAQRPNARAAHHHAEYPHQKDPDWGDWRWAERGGCTLTRLERPTRPHDPTVAVREPLANALAPPLTAPAILRAPTVAQRLRPQRTVLDNGLSIVVQENHANTTIALAGHLHAGGVFDPPDKPGLAGFVAALLSRGTKTRTMLQLAHATESVGASVSIGGGRPATVNFDARCLTKDFDVVLDVLSDELRNPSFPPEEIEKLRQRSLSALQQSLESTGARAERAFIRAIFPEGHPYSMPTVEQQRKALESFTRDDIVRFYEKHYGPDTASICIVGDVDAHEAVAAVKRYFGDWRPTGRSREVNIPDAPPTKGATRKVIPMMDKSQVDIIWGYWGGIKRTDPDFYRATVMSFILGGGALTSRLGARVRDEMGLAYAIWCYFRTYQGRADFRVELGTNPKNVDKALQAAVAEIRRMRDEGATQEELQEALDYLCGSYPVRLETNAAVASELRLIEYYNLGLDYINRRNDIYRSVTLADVNEAAKKYLHPDDYVLVIAGPYEEKK